MRFLMTFWIFRRSLTLSTQLWFDSKGRRRFSRRPGLAEDLGHVVSGPRRSMLSGTKSRYNLAGWTYRHARTSPPRRPRIRNSATRTTAPWPRGWSEDQLGDRQASGCEAGTAWHPAQRSHMDEPGHGPGLNRARHRCDGRDAAVLVVQRCRTQSRTRSRLIPRIPSDEHQVGEHHPGGRYRTDLGRHCSRQRRLRPSPSRSALSGTPTPQLVCRKLTLELQRSTWKVAERLFGVG